MLFLWFMIRYTYDLTVTVKVSNIADLYNKVKIEPCVIHLPSQIFLCVWCIASVNFGPWTHTSTNYRTESSVWHRPLIYFYMWKILLLEKLKFLSKDQKRSTYRHSWLLGPKHVQWCEAFLSISLHYVWKTTGHVLTRWLF